MQQLLNASGERVAVADIFIAVENGFEGRTGGETVLYQDSVIGAGCTIAEYTPPPPIAPVPEKENRWITKGAFRNRFTSNEKIAIEFASLDNPNDPIQKRQMAAVLRVADADVMASTYIDLDRPDTAAGVQKMEDFGIIAAGRADEILNAEIKDFERFVQ